MKSESAAHPSVRPSKRFVFEAKPAKPAPRDGLDWRLQIFVFVAAALLVISRRPDALLNPQFFGEDGSVWFPEAYMLGWLNSLIHSQNGYYQTFPRLVSALALIVPFRLAPLVMNIIGIAVQILPVTLLLSARCRDWAPLNVRALMAFVYIALPNSFELNAAIEEGQWHLALAACIVVLATVPRSLWSRIFDVSLILLSGLSGPFSVLLLPVSVVMWWFRRERWRLVIVTAIAVIATIQLHALIASASATRPHVGLGATPSLFVRLLAGQVYLGALLGGTVDHTNRSAGLLIIVALLGTAVVLFCLMKARLELKLFVSFAFLVFAVSLRNPMVSMTQPQWEVLRQAAGIRYWFFPMLGFAWALIWCMTSSPSWVMRILALAGGLLMLAGITRDWEYPAYPDLHFQQYARRFETAAPGTLAIIPIAPAGWSMRLTKHAPLCHSMPLGRIDLPHAGAMLGTSTITTGWVVAAKPLRKISLYIDGAPLQQSVKQNIVRPDVDARYPQSPIKDKGWGGTLDLSKVSPGPHEIEARAQETDGCDAEFDFVTVQRVK